MKKRSKSKTKNKKPASGAKKAYVNKVFEQELVPATKTHEELKALRLGATLPSGASGTIVACWFKDPGGADQCIPMDSNACTNAGGIPRPGNCPD
jgi:hypothetical protein